jgi:hypothetical protein
LYCDRLIENALGAPARATILPVRVAGSARQQQIGAVGIPGDGLFTEGFDTADLKDAKALLDELA